MAHTVNSDVEDVLRGSGGALAFITYAQATAGMPAPQFWSFCYFLMLGFLAVDSEFGMVETCLTFLFDEYAIFRRFKILTVVGFGLFGKASMQIIATL